MRIVMGGDEDDPLLAVIAGELVQAGHQVVKVGAQLGAPCPWGEVAIHIAAAVANGEADRGIVCCYTGTGVSIAANKVRGVRAALCADAETARGAREWNDANVLALSFRSSAPAVAREIVRAFLTTAYGHGEDASLSAIRRAEGT